jgi:hypothetical protein
VSGIDERACASAEYTCSVFRIFKFLTGAASRFERVTMSGLRTQRFPTLKH